MPQDAPADLIEEAARKHGVSPDAARTVWTALQAGHGTMAQFSHREFGGMCQWSSGGMTMVGDMFDERVKAKVAALCADLSGHVRQDGKSGGRAAPADATHPAARGAGGDRGTGADRDWWPGDLHFPAATGSQNDMRYAAFPKQHRLAVEQRGRVTVYDTGDHAISGVAQAQGGTQSLTFTSQKGTVGLDDLRKVG